MTDGPRLVTVLPKAADLEIHVRIVTSAGREVLEFVDYVPSLEHYGRGYWVPLADRAGLAALADALRAEAGDA